MKKVYKTIVLFCCTLLFAGCSNQASPETVEKTDIFPRTIITSSGTEEAVDIQVFVEGSDGNELTGALVLVTTNTSSVKRIDFDVESFSYKTQISYPSDGKFTFSISSSLVEEKKEFTLYHKKLSMIPCISKFCDSEANSVLEGNTLLADKEIQLGWNSLGDGVIYVVTIKTALQTVYSVSTKAQQIIIPANTLTADTAYFAQIQAQQIDGDPTFTEVNYYSASVYDNSNLGFSVE